jgi:hypothetical protein
LFFLGWQGVFSPNEEKETYGFELRFGDGAGVLLAVTLGSCFCAVAHGFLCDFGVGGRLVCGVVEMCGGGECGDLLLVVMIVAIAKCCL